eukprot:1141541-Pelagomonas_calceolata.AAC.5
MLPDLPASAMLLHGSESTAIASVGHGAQLSSAEFQEKRNFFGLCRGVHAYPRGYWRRPHSSNCQHK